MVKDIAKYFCPGRSIISMLSYISCGDASSREVLLIRSDNYGDAYFYVRMYVRVIGERVFSACNFPSSLPREMRNEDCFIKLRSRYRMSRVNGSCVTFCARKFSSFDSQFLWRRVASENIAAEYIRRRRGACIRYRGSPSFERARHARSKDSNGVELRSRIVP